jgi:shikimate kinase
LAVFKLHNLRIYLNSINKTYLWKFIIKKEAKVIKNLTLTGMMGVGKSTIGKNLAKKLKYNFVDVDKIIESREGQSINLIFKNKSEGYFRKIENDVTLFELKKEKSVISMGGGAFLNNTIRKSAKKSSVSFWLDVPIAVLIKRLKKSRQRPLLYKQNLDETVKKIYYERKKIYNEADYRIKCNSLKLSEIINRIIYLYEKSGN